MLLRPFGVLGGATRGTIQNVVCRQFAYICDMLTFICDPFALVGQRFALLGDPFPLNRDILTFPCGAYDWLIHGTQTPLR